MGIKLHENAWVLKNIHFSHLHDTSCSADKLANVEINYENLPPSLCSLNNPSLSLYAVLGAPVPTFLLSPTHPLQKGKHARQHNFIKNFRPVQKFPSPSSGSLISRYYSVTIVGWYRLGTYVRCMCIVLHSIARNPFSVLMGSSSVITHSL